MMGLILIQPRNGNQEMHAMSYDNNKRYIYGRHYGTASKKEKKKSCTETNLIVSLSDDL
jgi:hypothetical protein